MLKIRRPLGRLIFNMGIAIPGKTVFLIETAPRMSVDKHWAEYDTQEYTIFDLADETGIIPGMGSPNETSRLTIASSLTGWAHIQNDPSEVIRLSGLTNQHTSV